MSGITLNIDDPVDQPEEQPEEQELHEFDSEIKIIMSLIENETKDDLNKSYILANELHQKIRESYNTPSIDSVTKNNLNKTFILVTDLKKEIKKKY